MNAVGAVGWRDYLELCKPRVVLLMLLTALIGMLMSESAGLPPLKLMLLGIVGIALCAGSAAVINHLADRHIDARMARTAKRPLPRGRISAPRALAFAAALGVAGAAILFLQVNALSAWLSLAALFGYALIYTFFLKRATPLNIVIGGLAGAAPPLLGWTAISGRMDAEALLLVLIIFTWTPPHFWALALHRREEYAAVEVPMLPVTHGAQYTRWQILFYTLLLLVASLLPFAVGMSGWLYLLAALALGAGYLRWALSLLRLGDSGGNLGAFRYSIIYLGLLFVALLADHYLLPASTSVMLR